MLQVPPFWQGELLSPHESPLGDALGDTLGLAVGRVDGGAVGLVDGLALGEVLGLPDGAGMEGLALGDTDGELVGSLPEHPVPSPPHTPHSSNSRVDSHTLSQPLGAG